ncbi:DUF3426 domain-containing protein [Gammaproteobacteria bacterium]|nr:DUF3426 domain-containing protein [Gammaproteobacteria bacterium]
MSEPRQLTQCPHCDVIYSLSDEQARLRSARCVHCQHRFSPRGNLLRRSRDAVAAGPNDDEPRAGYRQQDIVFPVVQDKADGEWETMRLPLVANRDPMSDELPKIRVSRNSDDSREDGDAAKWVSIETSSPSDDREQSPDEPAATSRIDPVIEPIVTPAAPTLEIEPSATPSEPHEEAIEPTQPALTTSPQAVSTRWRKLSQRFTSEQPRASIDHRAVEQTNDREETMSPAAFDQRVDPELTIDPPIAQDAIVNSASVDHDPSEVRVDVPADEHHASQVQPIERSDDDRPPPALSAGQPFDTAAPPSDMTAVVDSPDPSPRPMVDAVSHAPPVKYSRSHQGLQPSNDTPRDEESSHDEFAALFVNESGNESEVALDRDWDDKRSNDDSSYHSMTRSDGASDADEVSNRASWLGWTMLIVGLLALLFVQLNSIWFGAMAASPTWRPVAQFMADLTGSEMPPIGSASQIDVFEQRVSESGDDSLLDLQFTLRNNANIEQPVPTLELTLSDSVNKVLSRRLVPPAEYSGLSLAPLAGGEVRSFAIRLRQDHGTMAVNLTLRPVDF